MIRLLLTPRWLSFTAVAVAAIVGFGALSLWQWNRAEEKRQDNAVVARNTSAASQDLAKALDSPDEWRRVDFTGRFEADQFLRRNRPLDGSQGFWVMTPFRLDNTDANDGEIVWVARGWIPQRTASTQSVEPPAPPTGPVTISGYLRAASDARAIPSDTFPVGQIAAINPMEMSEAAGLAPLSRSNDWYIQQEITQPRNSEIKTLPLPEVDDARNLSYAGQWMLFAAIAIGGWFFFLRREAAEEEPTGTWNPARSEGHDQDLPNGPGSAPSVIA